MPRYTLSLEIPARSTHTFAVDLDATNAQEAERLGHLQIRELIENCGSTPSICSKALEYHKVTVTLLQTLDDADLDPPI